MPNTRVPAAGEAVPSTITRRAVLGALAVASVALPSAAAGSGGKAYSEIAELIADFQIKEQEALVLVNRWEDLDLKHCDDLPEVEVTYMMRTEVDGMVSTKPFVFRNIEVIERFFEPHSSWSEDVKAAKKANCARLIAELRQAEADWEMARSDLGITQALDLVINSRMACQKALKAVFAYRPKSLDEMDVKNAFLLEWFESGCALSIEDARLVFGTV